MISTLWLAESALFAHLRCIRVLLLVSNVLNIALLSTASPSTVLFKLHRFQPPPATHTSRPKPAHRSPLLASIQQPPFAYVNAQRLPRRLANSCSRHRSPLIATAPCPALLHVLYACRCRSTSRSACRQSRHTLPHVVTLAANNLLRLTSQKVDAALALLGRHVLSRLPSRRSPKSICRLTAAGQLGR